MFQDILNYDEILLRIKNIYDSSTEQEKYYLRTILQELVETGDSNTYRDIWLSDYKEIPVDIDTFICDSEYLGETNRNGDSVYPYWRTVLRDIFTAGNQYEECFFTGATRIGKSSTAITATAYMLYKLMCLRDPQKYFGKKDISKFSILFFNVTKELAASVAYRELNDTLKASPWFNKHGKFSLSDRNFYYIPEGDKIIIDFGSDSAHALGQQVFVGFCLKGDTKIQTEDGVFELQDISQKTNYNPKVLTSIGEKPSDGVVLTKYVQDTIRIELEDGTIIEGTPEHRIMLENGEYVMLKDLIEGDELKEVEIEEWRYIKGFEGRCQVSNLGRVKVLAQELEIHKENIEEAYTLHLDEHIVKQRLSNTYNPSLVPHWTVPLRTGMSTTQDGSRKWFYVPKYVHLFILESFLGFTGGAYHFVDGDTTNCRLSNLRVGARDLGEDWRTVPSSNGAIQVSKDGRVWQNAYYIERDGMNSYFNEGEIHAVQGYPKRVSVWCGDAVRLKSIQQLIAEAFLDNPNGYKITRLKDGNKDNICLDNVEWSKSAGRRKSDAQKVRERKRKKFIIHNLNDDSIYHSVQEAATVIGASRQAIYRHLNKPNSVMYNYGNVVLEMIKEGDERYDYYSMR